MRNILKKVNKINEGTMRKDAKKDTIIVFCGSQIVEPWDDRSDLWMSLSMSSQRWGFY
ncbi:hypothetical protein [Vallitalea okinawensis]|uniref:hypothetical protein n=1 Tax=Vallitalea okinawensis TaxID=2078660 RepID=UPI001300A79B|nr:hypothetical protein [Vallitalea okinawensis]